VSRRVAAAAAATGCWGGGCVLEGEAMVVARDETQKVLRIRPIHDHNL
jgi:hypothetical protein